MKNYVITIARGFGSGGKSIGLALGKRLGIPCYEDEILKMASEMSGINEALFFENNEKRNGILKRLKKYPTTVAASPSQKNFVSNDNLFQIQAQIIRSLAENESCIIVGKCADYVLRDYDRVIRIYIDAPREACIQSIMTKMCVEREEAEKTIVKTDKYRADYYRYYTMGGEWTNPTNYDLFLNSDRVGRAKCIELIAMYAQLELGDITI